MKSAINWISPRGAVALLLSLNSRWWGGLLLFGLCLPLLSLAQQTDEVDADAGRLPSINHFPIGALVNAPINAGGYLARILSDSPEEVADALARAESLYAAGQLPPGFDPIAIVLHGPEVEIFFKDNYEEYKAIVDLAARLSAFGVVDVRVCETQTGIMGRERSSIHPFIGTVPFGPAEVKRLLDQQNYVYF